VTGMGAKCGARSNPCETGSAKAWNAEQSVQNAGRKGIERGAIRARGRAQSVAGGAIRGRRGVLSVDHRAIGEQRRALSVERGAIQVRRGTLSIGYGAIRGRYGAEGVEYGAIQARHQASSVEREVIRDRCGRSAESYDGIRSRHDYSTKPPKVNTIKRAPIWTAFLRCHEDLELWSGYVFTAADHFSRILTYLHIHTSRNICPSTVTTLQ
jgi:hypothetical protein